MKLKTYQGTFPATLVLVMVMFLFIIISANTSLSYAASHGKKSQAMERKSAVTHTEGQIKLLESALNITDAQKPLWAKVTQVMRENAKETDARHDVYPTNDSSHLPTPPSDWAQSPRTLVPASVAAGSIVERSAEPGKPTSL